MRPDHIIRRSRNFVSPWISILEKLIVPMDGKPPELFHSIFQPDYVSVIARTPSGKFPLIRQYRHSIETFTWEFPAGLLDEGELPEACAKRELFEEAGVIATSIVHLGTAFADSGRLANRVHMYYADCSEPSKKFIAEPDTSVEHFCLDELNAMILDGKISHQPHIGLLYLALLKGAFER